MLKIQARPLKTMHDEQCRSDQPVLLVVPVELEFCLVYGAADSLLTMMLHDVPAYWQIAGCRYIEPSSKCRQLCTLFAVLFCIFDYIFAWKAFCTCIGILGVVSSRQGIFGLQ